MDLCTWASRKGHLCGIHYEEPETYVSGVLLREREIRYNSGRNNK